ncbi:uncharacterized protein [Apostichopus japonicus]|uniref:uncharacterized protein n=1 Tax=Stichopus japonicus TaxID=307972 RepID=UPI003AB2A796
MNIYEFSLTLACLFLALLSVTTTPIDLDDEMLDRELRGDELFEGDLDDNMAAFRRDDDSFVRDAKAAQWSKNFMGISSLDNSVKGFASQHLRCRNNDVCKYAGKKMFKCKCNSLQYCVAATPMANAYCKYSAVGFVYEQ